MMIVYYRIMFFPPAIVITARIRDLNQNNVWKKVSAAKRSDIKKECQAIDLVSNNKKMKKKKKKKRRMREKRKVKSCTYNVFNGTTNNIYTCKNSRSPNKEH